MKSRKSCIVILLCMFIVTGRSSAQGTKSKCPTVRVSSPAEVSVGDQLMFVANVDGGDAAVTPTYNWTVSAGSISSGQGTSAITLSVTDAEGGQSITATVDVGGYPRECYTSYSSTTSVMKKAVARKIIEYKKIRLPDEQAKLDFFTIELQNDPTSTGYIISYAGIKSMGNIAVSTSARAKKYMIDKRGISADRIITIDGGYRESEITELYIVPQGAMPPTPAPTVEPPVKKPAAIKKPVSKTKKT